MVSNECKEQMRTVGMLAEHIICLADCYDDSIEEYRKKVFYRPEYENKENIISEMKITAAEATRAVKGMNFDDLIEMYNENGISITEYTDALSCAVFAEPFNNEKVRNAAKAIESMTLDLLYAKLENDSKYKEISGGL